MSGTMSHKTLTTSLFHRVRNPLSAAISANKFVSLAVHELEPLTSVDARKAVREDVIVINNSLQYINDLLRSMLDFHSAQCKQIVIKTKHTSIRHDIFDPVKSMLYHRGCDFDVLVECPGQLVVLSDPLRLKQVILNLAVNAMKFVVKGFVRLSAEVKDGSVVLYVEDSGPGIPSSKKSELFQKFQSSLDALSQGTGMGLSLCKQLVELMNGTINLDTAYDTGVEGCPGCRFVITLGSPPMQYESSSQFLDEVRPIVDLTPKPSVLKRVSSTSSCETNSTTADNSLPERLSVLFVDDDFILRKLFVRSIHRCQPTWTVDEAASGETVLQLIESRGPDKPFDLIFIDQYMASVQKQLLGTETIRLIRSKGIDSLICGLSANEIESQFMDAGADYFLMKPLPTEGHELLQALQRILTSKRSQDTHTV